MYPAFVDLASFTSNGVNGISFLAENSGDRLGYGYSAGNIFNTSETALIIGAPYASGYQGKAYVIASPRNVSFPLSGVIPILQAGSYFKRFFTITTSTTNEEICATVNIADFDLDGVDDIACGSFGAGAQGGINFIRGGTWLQSISNINVGSLNGINGCRVGPFFTGADNCGYASAIAKNMTGDGRNGFVIGCGGAFSYVGAVVLVPYKSNFCPGGSITSANFDGVTATYYKGTLANIGFGYSVAAANLRNAGSDDVIIGTYQTTYVKFGGKTIMGVPPLSLSSAERIFTNSASLGTPFSNFISNFGNLFGDGCDTLGLGAIDSSTLGQSNAGRTDVIRCGARFPNTNLTLPSGLNGTNGYTIYDTVANDQLGAGGYGIGDIDGDLKSEFVIASYGSRFGRANSGTVALCFGQHSMFENNNTIIYQNLLNGAYCSEFIGSTAGERIGGARGGASLNLWNYDSIKDWGIGSASANPTKFYVVYGDSSPYLSSSPYIANLPKCSSTVLTINNFNATDQNDPQTNFIYNINVSNGNATLGNNPTQIFNATYTQLANNQVNINRNCNNSPFSLSIGVKVVQQNVTKLAFLPPQSLTINFRPNVSFPLLNQNGNVRLAQEHLDAICDSNCGTTPSTIRFKVNGPGAFIAVYPNLSTPVSVVSKLDLLATAPAGVYLTSDGSSNQPLLDVTAMDNSTGLTGTALAQPVPFRSLPTLKNNLIFAVRNRTLLVTSNQLFASQKYNLTDVSNLILSADCQNGGFYSYVQQNFVSTLQNFNLSSGDMGFNAGINGEPKCNITVSDSVISSITPLNFTYYSGPRFGNKNLNLRINQGVTNQSVSLDFNFQNFLNDINYVLNLYSPQHISYACYDTFGNPQPICSLDDVQHGRFVQSHDGSLSVLDDGIARITDTTYDLNDEGRLIYTLVKRPQPVNASFPTLYQTGTGSSIKITTDMLDALCDAPCNTNASSLLYTFDVQNGLVKNQFSVPITQGTKRDMLNNNLYLTSAGINQKPILSYYITDMANSLPYNPLMSGPFLASIASFVDVPSALFTTWNMLEGVQFNLTRSLVNGTSNYIPNSANLVLDFDPSSVQNLEIRNTQTGPATSLTLGAIDANQGALIPGPGLPAAQARICYSTQCSPYQAIPVSSSSFGFAPRLNSINFTLAEGQRQRLSLSTINYSNPNSGDSFSATLASYRVNVSAKQFIEFYMAGTNTILSAFTLADVQNNLVEVANGGQASSCQMTLTDTSRHVPFGLTSSARQVQPVFGYKPVVVNNNAIEVNQTNSANAPAYFGTEALSASSTSSPVSSLNVLFSQQPACSIDSRQNPGKSLVSYGDLQSRSTRVTVTDPNSPIPCQFNVSFIDPSFNNVTYGPFAARVTFRDIPIVLTTHIDCTQGIELILQASNFNAKDNANNASNIFVNWLSLANAALTIQNSNNSAPVTSYSLSDQALNKIHFRPNAGAAAPLAVIQFVGSSRLPTAPITISQAANTLAFTVLHPAPLISLNQIITVRGTPVSLNPQLIGVTIEDISVSLADIIINIMTVRNGWVQRANFPININNAISQYTYSESTGVSNIVFVPDGTKNTPQLCVSAVTPAPESISNIGGQQCSPSYLIVPTVTPNILVNQLEIERNEALLITDEMLSGISGFAQSSNLGDLDWEMNCQNAVLETNSTGTITAVANNKFKSLNITGANIRLKASDTNNAVSCTARATNSDGTATAAETTVVQFIEKYYKAVMVDFTLPLEIGLSSYPILSSYISATDHVGNVGGKLFPLTQPSQMSFNISNMRGIHLPSAYDASNWVMVSAPVLSTLTLSGAVLNTAAFNISACNLAMNCSDPIAAIFNWQPSRAVTVTSDGGTSLSLIGGNATTYGITVAAVITGIGVLSRIFAPIISRVLNNDDLERNPLVTETFGLIDKELRISNPSSCFYTSANKRGKFIRACDTIVNKLQAEGVQTHCASTVKVNNKICGDCCSKDKKENDKKRELEYDSQGNQLLTAADVLNLSGIIFKHIKSICLPKKRSGCRKCCDLICACQRDLEDKNIVDNRDKIVAAIINELKDLGNLHIRKNLKVITDHTNVAVVELNSPSENTSAGRPLLLSSAAAAAAGVAVYPDHKSGETSAEISDASNNSGADLIKREHNRSQSPSGSGVLLFSNVATSSAMADVPGADGTTVELTSFGLGSADRGSRSQTPPPHSGAQSITATPPSPPAGDPPPPPPIAASL